MDRMQILNLVAYLVNVLITYAGGVASVFGGKTNSEVSNDYTSVVTPAGWAFAIWSIIFTGEGIFAIWQALPAQRESILLPAIGWWWVIACGIQSLWTFAFAYEVLWLSGIFLFSIACSMGKIYLNLQSPAPYEPPDSDELALTDVEPPIIEGLHQPIVARISYTAWWIVVFPFSVHFGWLIAASIVNINLFAIKAGASVDAQYTLAGISFGVAALAPVVLSWPKKEPIVGFVCGWALLAISAKLNASDGAFQQGPDASDVTAFDTDKLGEFADAAKGIAIFHLSCSGVLLLLAFYRCYLELSAPQQVDDAPSQMEKGDSQALASPHAKDNTVMA